MRHLPIALLVGGCFFPFAPPTSGLIWYRPSVRPERAPAVTRFESEQVHAVTTVNKPDETRWRMPFTFKMTEQETTLVLDAIEHAVDTGLETPAGKRDDFAEVAAVLADRLKW